MRSQALVRAALQRAKRARQPRYRDLEKVVDRKLCDPAFRVGVPIYVTDCCAQDTRKL